MLLTRRRFVVASGATAATLALWQQPAVAAAPNPEQVHLTFGADPRTTMVVTWSVPAPVANPRVAYGTAAAGTGTTVAATTRSYVNTAGRVGAATVTVLTATLAGLAPGTRYVYTVTHDGASAPVRGSFTTAPAGRAPFTFTSFGDQAAPSVDTASGKAAGNPIFAVAAGISVVGQIEAVAPLFHLVNGDLCYGNLAADPVTTWASFLNNNSPSAANRPWMPCPGNHENEPQTTANGTGPEGYAAYRCRFPVPSNGSSDFEGLWYSFDVGNVRIVALNGDDAALQNGGSSNITGYSAGEQARWLEATLRSARAAGSGIDWIVVVQHQVLTSSANGNGCDLGLRQVFGPLFDAYDVDLVLCGHEHDYERTFPVHGTDTDLLRPAVVAGATSAGSGGADVVDSVGTTVHMVLGGGGCNVPTNVYMDQSGTDMAKVITSASGSATEVATWSRVRDAVWSWGFGRFDVDPGRPGGHTTITATYLRTLPSGASATDTVTLTRPVPSDAPGATLAESPAAVLVPAAAVAAGAALVRHRLKDA